MSVTGSHILDATAAERLLRHLESDDALEAGILTPMAGTRPVRLFSLEEAERFLTVHDAQAVDFAGQWATINYVDPEHLADWVGDVLGDPELADGLREIASSRRAYGYLVPELKARIASRIAEAERALAPDGAARR